MRVSGNTPSFNTGIFCSLLQWELSWGAKSLLTASAEVLGTQHFNSHFNVTSTKHLGWDYIREIKIWIVFHRESTIEISLRPIHPAIRPKNSD